MKHYHHTLVIKAITLLATIVAFSTLLATPLLAQRDTGPGRPLTPGERLELRRARQSTIMNQEMQLKGLVKDKDWIEPDRAPYLRAIVQQAKQDFERIQIVNDEIMRAVSANTGFNYKNLAEQTGEIKKRAKRFKENINLPPPDETQPSVKKLDQISREEMRAALILLGEQVVSFATNPLFQTPNLMDVKLGAKASRDLDAMIELSGVIRKNAERLSKLQQQQK
ncbi:MAG TPA: hypothetical protein VM911_15860 [Pyrinomonadaceae bacterium]|jgi:hypothetical protein|nr:hypothetical protein [Pyrinomonadaceae bacterium]